MTPEQLSEFQNDENELTSRLLSAASPRLILAALSLLDSSKGFHDILQVLLEPFATIVEGRRGSDPRAKLQDSTNMTFNGYVKFLLTTIADDPEFNLPTWRLITNSSVANSMMVSTVINKVWPILCFNKSNHRQVVPQQKGIARIITLLLPSEKELIRDVKSSLDEVAAVQFAQGFATRLILEALLRHAPDGALAKQDSEEEEEELKEQEETVTLFNAAVQKLAITNQALLLEDSATLTTKTSGTSSPSLPTFYNPFKEAPSTPVIDQPLLSTGQIHSIPLVETTDWDRVSSGVTRRSLLSTPKVASGKPLVQRSLMGFLSPTPAAQAAPSSTDRMANWVSRAEAVSTLEPFQQYAATAQEEFFKLYCPMIEYSQGKQFKTALTLFLITWACNRNPPRADQLYRQRYSKTGMLIPSISGFFYQFKQTEETVSSSGSLRRGLANPSLATTVFNPDEHLDLYVRAAQSEFEHYFPYTFKILVALLESEIYKASMENTDFNLVQGERSSRARHLQRYLVEIKRLQQVLFGFSNPAEDSNKIIKSYSMLSFHLITWNSAFARGDLRLLHHNFVERYALYNLVPLCLSSPEHKTVIFQDALWFLNYRCIECYRAGGCNLWCRYCPEVGGGVIKAQVQQQRRLPPQYRADFQAARTAAKGRLSQATWAAMQSPVIELLDEATTDSTASQAGSQATSNLLRALAHQHLITDHLPIHLEF